MARLAYSQSDGTQDLFPKRQEPKVHHHSLQVPVEKFAGSPRYEKEDGNIEPRLYFVISGGTTRERHFLQTLINNKDKIFHSLNLIFLSSAIRAGGLTPKMMDIQWKEIQRSGRIRQHGRDYVLEDIDKVYMITDVDHYETVLREILRRGQKSCEWIISNPCIELWLYYCYFEHPKVDLESVRSAEPSKRSLQMKAINDKLLKGGIDPRKAFFNMRRGIANAKKCYEDDATHFPALLSTQMWKFCEDIEYVISEEFEKWHQAEINRIRLYSK